MKVHGLSEEQLAAFFLLLRRRKRRRTRTWVHPLNLLRPTLGEHIKVELMYEKYPDRFVQYTRMTPCQFDKLLGLINLEIERQDTSYRLAIPARHRLFVALRYLATGDSFQTIATSFSIGKATVIDITRSVNEAIWKCLSPIYLKAPTKEDWQNIVEDYYKAWNFPNCLGGIDGKHVGIRAPPNSGSTCFNYKGFFSIVLLATCDAHYRFTTVDIGAYGRQSDSGIFQNSILGTKLDSGSLELPEDQTLPNSTLRQPCTFVGDDAFSLSSYMMKPYSFSYTMDQAKKIFNYRLSRARRVIENCFGIMGNRFLIFKRSIMADPENVVNIVQATVVLHNFLRTEEMELDRNSQTYCPPGYVDTNDENNGEWRLANSSGAFRNLKPNSKHNHSKNAKMMRDNLAAYFVTNGAIAFQYDKISN